MKLKEPFDIKNTNKMVTTEILPKNAIAIIGNEKYRVYYRKENTNYVQFIGFTEPNIN